jgi:very-short-patch-repair endonuclease
MRRLLRGDFLTPSTLKVEYHVPRPWREGIEGRGIKTLGGKLTRYAKILRRDSTEAEKLLWSKLKAKQLDGLKFRRQQPVGSFIVDFVCFEKGVVVELDGGQHAANAPRDAERDGILTRNGFRVLRFWNNDVLQDIDGVVDAIRKNCRD